jgi:hypothetical protein
MATRIASVAIPWPRRFSVTHQPASTSSAAIPSMPPPAKRSSAPPRKLLSPRSRIAHGPKPCSPHCNSAPRVSRNASSGFPDARACSASSSRERGVRISRAVRRAIVRSAESPTQRPCTPLSMARPLRGHSGHWPRREPSHPVSPRDARAARRRAGAEGRLRECTLRPQRCETLRPARGVPAIDDRAERKEGGVLCERHGHRRGAASPRLRISDSKHRAVRRVHGQARERPGSRTGHRFAEHGDVRVIVAQHPLVERLDCGPHERSNRACLRGVHAATLAARRPRHPA